MVQEWKKKNQGVYCWVEVVLLVVFSEMRATIVLYGTAYCVLCVRGLEPHNSDGINRLGLNSGSGAAWYSIFQISVFNNNYFS